MIGMNGSHRRACLAVSRRNRVLPHRRICLAVDPKPARRRALARPFNMARTPNLAISIHTIHRPPSARSPWAQDADFYSATVSPSDRFR